MTDDELTATIATIAAADPGALASTVELARRRAQVLMLIFGIAMVAVVLLSLGGLVIIATSSRTAAHENGQRIDALTEKLTEAQAKLTAASATNAELADCQERFAANVRNGTRDSIVAQSELVVILATVVPEDRPAKVGAAIKTLTDSAAAYRSATKAFNEWSLKPAAEQLPCPISSVVTPP